MKTTISHATQTTSDSELAKINHKIVANGEALPIVRLRDGSRVQTGTVAALIHNIKHYDQAACSELAHQILAAIPTLQKVGLFELFPASQWRDTESPGKCLVADYLHNAALPIATR